MEMGDGQVDDASDNDDRTEHAASSSERSDDGDVVMSAVEEPKRAEGRSILAPQKSAGKSQGSAANAEDSDPLIGPRALPNKPRKVKKPTYAVRKEKAFLLKELDVLQAQLKHLRQQAATNATQAEMQRSNLQQELSREFLNGAVQHQQLSLVNVQSALSGYVSVQQHVPFEMWIYLGTNVEERRETLAALKARKLHASKQYTVERTRFLDPTSPFAEHSRFVALNGDYCALRFDITPYEGISDVRKVYDALCHYFSHMEIWVTDILGDVTIREDDDSAGQGISQNRLVSSLTNGVQLELNTVMYTEFREHDDEYAGGGAYGLFTADYVDKDELYPYKSDERVRYDVTAALSVKAHQRKKLNAAGEVEEEQVVVLTRSCLVKLRHGQISLPFETAHELRESWVLAVTVANPKQTCTDMPMEWTEAGVGTLRHGPPRSGNADEPLSEEILLSLLQTYYPMAPCDSTRKRTLTSEESGSTSDDSNASTPTAARTALSSVNNKKKQKKGRTPSHVAKREEKQLLLKELEYLEARATLLRREAGVPDPKEVAATELQAAANRQLRETIEVQQTAIAAAQSAFAEFTTVRAHNPLKTFIHLGRDVGDRRAAVCALKHERLQCANQFLKQRMRLVTDPRRFCHEESGYLTDEGDYVSTQLDVHHFTGVQSVKQVFDVMQFYFLNMEITATELGDCLTLREDTNDLEVGADCNEQPMLHHRLVTMLSNGPVVEKNAVKFFQYVDDDEDEGPYGVMSASPVDQDDLYPYCPAERIRKDVWAAMKLSSFTRKKHPQVAGEAEETELVVVLTRWFRVQMIHSELKYPPHVMQEVRRSVSGFTDLMIRSMNQTLYGAM
ncbi:hypothetical protein BBJ28_00022445 [Nothophytophthora sp. Chile5]|nr:hypothetical protein BBJ28_00022445 [Nothophytophthora sp. Chile5]